MTDQVNFEATRPGSADPAVALAEALGQLPKTLLTSPHACVNDFEEQLSRSGVENENSAV